MYSSVPVNVSTLFDTLSGGALVEPAIQPYYDYLGSFFWLILFGLSLLMLYGKTQDYSTVAIVGMLVAPVVILMVAPQIQLIAYVLIAIGIAGVLYKTFY